MKTLSRDRRILSWSLELAISKNYKFREGFWSVWNSPEKWCTGPPWSRTGRTWRRTRRRHCALQWGTAPQNRGTQWGRLWTYPQSPAPPAPPAATPALKTYKGNVTLLALSLCTVPEFSNFENSKNKNATNATILYVTLYVLRNTHCSCVVSLYHINKLKSNILDIS